MALGQVQSQQTPLPILGGAYEASSLPISAQEAINCYLEAGPGSTNPVALRGVPGATQFSDLTNIRALHEAFGFIYAVAGSEVYKVSKAGDAQLLGTVADDSRPAYLSHNIFELAITSGGEWYTVQRTGEVTKIDTPRVSHGHFLDGYILAREVDTGRFIWSEINDADSVSGADFATAEGSPDNIVALLVDHREIFLFGENSLERWYNDGVSPFIRLPNGFSERGCGAGDSPAKLDNTVFWLGDDLVVYRLSEGRPERVSNHGIEQLIQRVSNPSRGVGLSYSQDGHAFYQINFPGQLTVTYDASTQTWHTRKLFGRNDAGYSHHVYAFNNHYVGGPKLWKLGGQDFNGPLERIRTIGPIRTGRRYASMFSVTLYFETGSSAVYADDKHLLLEVSDDGGRTFKNRREVSLGSKGQYHQEVRINGLGAMRDNQRVMRFTLTDAADFNLVGAVAEIG